MVNGMKHIKLIYRFLSSKLLAAYLIGIITVMATVGMLIPQKPSSELMTTSSWYSNVYIIELIDLLQLNEIFYSWWFIVISVLFLLNLVTCTCKHALLSLRLWRTFEIQTFEYEQMAGKSLYNIGLSKTDVDKLAQKNSLKVFTVRNTLVLQKHRWGVFSSVIFHFGLILVVLGGLLTLTMKMSGYATVGVGETRIENHQLYHNIEEGFMFSLVDGHTDYGIKLKKQERFYKGKENDYVSSTVEIYEQDQLIKSAIVERGQPLAIGDLRLFHYNSGFAPGLIIKDSRGRVLHAGYILLDVVDTDENSRHLLRDFNIPNTNLKVNIELFPNFVYKDSKAFSDGDKPLNPRFEIKVEESGRELVNDLIGLDKTLQGGDYTITLTQMSNWTGFEIVRDTGANVLFFGSTMALLGLAMLYLANPCRVILTTSDHRLYYISGYYSKNRRIMTKEFTHLLTNK